MSHNVIFVEPWAAASAVNMSGTGNVQSGALESGSVYLLQNGSTQAIRYRFGASAATAVGTDAVLPVAGSIAFRASTDVAAHVAVIGENGASAHTASLVKIKGKR